jgi:hypothetical protein
MNQGDKGRRGVLLFVVVATVSMIRVANPVLDGLGVYLGALAFFIVPMTWLPFFCVLPLSFLWCLSGRLFPPWKRFGPLALQAFVVAITWTGYLESVVTKLNFHWRVAERTRIVEMIRRGELAAAREDSDVRPTVALPDGYEYLSSGGRVSVTRRQDGFSVTFYVKRFGMFPNDNYTAFIYRSDAGEPTNEDEDTDHFTEVQDWGFRWFFVRHT